MLQWISPIPCYTQLRKQTLVQLGDKQSANLHQLVYIFNVTTPTMDYTTMAKHYQGESYPGTQIDITTHTEPCTIYKGGNTRTSNTKTRACNQATTPTSAPHHSSWHQSHVTGRKRIWWIPHTCSNSAPVQHKFTMPPRSWHNGKPILYHCTATSNDIPLPILHNSASNGGVLGGHFQHHRKRHHPTRAH